MSLTINYDTIAEALIDHLTELISPQIYPPIQIYHISAEHEILIYQQYFQIDIYSLAGLLLNNMTSWNAFETREWTANNHFQFYRITTQASCNITINGYYQQWVAGTLS